jgi:Tol biopolymer transport system component
MKRFFVNGYSLFLFLFINYGLSAQEQSWQYLSQTLPEETPVIFAPGIVSIEGRYEYGLSVSPDGKEIFYTTDSPGDGLTVTKWDGSKWTTPETANLRGNKSWEYEAFYTPDGKKLFFTSDTSDVSKFWYAEKDTSGWGKVQYLDSPVNSSAVMWCSFTSDETMYYGNNDNLKIHRARLVDGKYSEIENLGFNGTHPSVAPDDSFFLFNSSQYGGYGKNDILIVFRKKDGSWTSPMNMGNKINTSYGETCASLSPEGKYIFFSRYNEPGGKCNIYWVRAGHIIDSLKKDVLTNQITIQFQANENPKVYRNSTNDKLTVSFSRAHSQQAIVEIYNTEGKLISRSFHTRATATIDLTGNKKGIYLIKIIREGRIFNEKIILN